jgi:hypothetical protein
MAYQKILMDQLVPPAGLRLENQVAVVTGGARGMEQASSGVSLRKAPE